MAPNKRHLWFGDALRDLRHAARLLRRNAVFTVTAALSLAIGIGANTSVFMLVDALVLRPPAGVREPDRLVEIASAQGGVGFNPTSYPVYLEVRSRTTLFDGVYASPMGTQPVDIADRGEALGRVFARYVTPNYFTVLGALPAAGRLFDARDDEAPGASPVVVLSHRLWRQRFQQDPAVVGRTLRVNDRVHTIVGVAAEDFQGPGIRRTDLWVPLGMLPDARSALASSTAGWLMLGGRLKPGVTHEAAAAAVASIDANAGVVPADPVERRQLQLLPMSPVQGGDALPTFLTLLLGLVAAVLAIACANVTGVLVARAAARQREVAVRMAIGGSRGRLIRQFLAETLLLFLAGGALGVLLAQSLTSFMVSLLPTLPFTLDVSLTVNGRAMLYTTAVVLLVSLLSGLMPALYASKPNIVASLGAGVRTRGRLRLRRTLVVVQAALSILLVVISGLFARSIYEVGTVDPGFDTRDVTLVSLEPTAGRRVDDAEVVAVREALNRIRELPRVESATLALTAPGGFEGVGIGGISRGGEAGVLITDGDLNGVESGYFSSLRIPILAGRDFTDADRKGTPPVVIVGQGTVARLWPNLSAAEVLGQTLLHHPLGPMTAPSQVVAMQVVGVAGDVKFGSVIDGAADVQIYVPYEQQPFRLMLLAVRARDGGNVADEVRSILATLSPRFRVTAEQSAAEYASVGLLTQRIAAYVAGGLGVFGLLLAGIGLYGVTAYSVSHRTREIGIRTALGARRLDIMQMIAGEGLRLGVAGSVIGLLLGAGAGQILATALVGVEPTDAMTFTSAGVLFGAITLLACCVPAYRAASVGPTDALRSD